MKYHHVGIATKRNWNSSALFPPGFVVFLYGFAGSAAVEILNLLRHYQTDADHLPLRYRKKGFWAVRSAVAQARKAPVGIHTLRGGGTARPISRISRSIYVSDLAKSPYGVEWICQTVRVPESSWRSSSMMVLR